MNHKKKTNGCYFSRDLKKNYANLCSLVYLHLYLDYHFIIYLPKKYIIEKKHIDYINEFKKS